jgi:hypothetical protein
MKTPKIKFDSKPKTACIKSIRDAKIFRYAMGVSQKSLAEHLGMQPHALCQIESGKRDVLTWTPDFFDRYIAGVQLLAKGGEGEGKFKN